CWRGCSRPIARISSASSSSLRPRPWRAPNTAPATRLRSSPPTPPKSQFWKRSRRSSLSPAEAARSPTQQAPSCGGFFCAELGLALTAVRLRGRSRLEDGGAGRGHAAALQAVHEPDADTDRGEDAEHDDAEAVGEAGERLAEHLAQEIAGAD